MSFGAHVCDDISTGLNVECLPQLVFVLYKFWKVVDMLGCGLLRLFVCTDR